MKDRSRKNSAVPPRVTVGVRFIRHGLAEVLPRRRLEDRREHPGFEAGLAKTPGPHAGPDGLGLLPASSCSAAPSSSSASPPASRPRSWPASWGVAVMHVHRAQGLFLSVQSGHRRGYESALVLPPRASPSCSPAADCSELCRFPGGRSRGGSEEVDGQVSKRVNSSIS